jgi:hypothetical protein
MKSVILIFLVALAAFSQSAPVAAHNDVPYTATDMYLEGSAVHLHGAVTLTLPFGTVRAEDAVVDLKANTVTIRGDLRIDLH